MLATKHAAVSFTLTTSAVETTMFACVTTPVVFSVTAAQTKFSRVRASEARVHLPTTPHVARAETVLVALRRASVTRHAGPVEIVAAI